MHHNLVIKDGDVTKVEKEILVDGVQYVDSEPREGSLNPVTSGGVAGAVDAISDAIPEGASADNKLVDQATLREESLTYYEERTIKLGADIFNTDDATYDSDHWSVDSDGKITFTTTTATNAEFDTGIVVPNNSVYLIEVEMSNYTRLSQSFYLKVGSDPQYDIYNGTASPFGAVVGNGGSLKIVPYNGSNLNFTLSIKLSPVVTYGSFVREKTYACQNISFGNGEEYIVDASLNVAIGPKNNTFSKNRSATRCIAIGRGALDSVETGWQNIAIGTFAMAQLKNGERNVAVGADSLYLFPNAQENVAVGWGALQGKGSEQNQTASKNVVIGIRAGGLNTSSEENSVYIGHLCGQSGIGSRCVFIGANTPGFSGGGKNRIGIGYGVQNNVDNTTVIGNSSMTETKVFGNLVVEGSDHVKRRIVFNNDNTVSWETIS